VVASWLAFHGDRQQPNLKLMLLKYPNWYPLAADQNLQLCPEQQVTQCFLVNLRGIAENG